MKSLLFTVSSAVASVLAGSPALAYEGSTFNQVWSKIKSDPYEIPRYEVTAASMFDWGRSLIQNAAERTISTQDDLLPRFTKLVHANGICLRGVWSIDQDSPYSGYFAKGSKGLFISRISTAFSAVDRGEQRAFGFTGKIFPTLDANAKVKTGNFFTIDDFTGTLAPHFLDTSLTNAPALTVRPDVIGIADLAVVVASAFAAVDVFPNIRQMYLVSELGLPAGSDAVTPKRTKISASAGQPRIDAVDFRKELDSKLYPQQTLHFDIAVASKEEPAAGDWQTIGRIDLTDSVVSDSCDHALHFQHPKWRTDLNETVND